MEKIIVSNLAIDYNLAKFRDKDTDEYMCNLCVDNISLFLAGELTKYLAFKEKEIVTPLGKANSRIICDSVILIPVMRAGISMLSAFQRIIPMAKTGFIWAHRDENANSVIDKYKMPGDSHQDEIIKDSSVIILDPMLATAGTINKCVELLQEKQPRQILVASVLATQFGINHLSEGIRALAVAAEKDGLDEKKYITPGVGDAGDRLFG